tara:strand:+ start:1148 stop:1714 length:567 start_codon:yes stop_codon:yes gene_type:complete
MIKSLNQYILHLDNYVSNDITDQILSNLKPEDFEEHTFYNPRTGEYINVSGNQELEMSWKNTPGTSILMNKIYKGLQNYIDHVDTPWFTGWNGYSGPRFNKYTKNKLMAPHCDHIHSLFDGTRQGVPILSILGVLNDDFEGGEFLMFEDEEIKLKKGDMLIFPANFLYPHQVNAVKKGTRYSWISWAW